MPHNETLLTEWRSCNTPEHRCSHPASTLLVHLPVTLQPHYSSRYTLWKWFALVISGTSYQKLGKKNSGQKLLNFWIFIPLSLGLKDTTHSKNRFLRFCLYSGTQKYCHQVPNHLFTRHIFKAHFPYYKTPVYLTSIGTPILARIYLILHIWALNLIQNCYPCCHWFIQVLNVFQIHLLPFLLQSNP